MSQPSFSVTSAQHNIELDEQGQGEATFTVTNTKEHPRRAQLKVYVQGDANISWLTLEGEPARDFAASQTQTVSVKVKVPEGTPAGSYSFRLHAILANDPDGDFAEGPWITMEVEDTDSDDDDGISKGLIAGLIAAGVFLIAGIGLAIFFLTSGGGEDLPQVAMIPVENVIGQSIEEATEKLEAKGFVIEKVFEPSDGPEGEVLNQDLVDIEVDTGATITLTVAEAPSEEAQEVKEVVGMSIKEATEILEGQSFVVKKRMEISEEAPGTVLEQDVMDVERPAGSTITLIVSMLPSKEVEDVIDMPIAEATEILEEQGFVVEKTMKASEKAPGTVLEQDPINTDQPLGTTVALTIASVPVIKVSDFRGESIEDAREELEEKGFEVNENPVTSDRPKGEVLTQDPSANTEVAMGSTITLTIAATPLEKIADVKGETYDEAKDILEDKGFEVRKMLKPSEEIPGTVLDQTPFNTKVAAGALVTLIVATPKTEDVGDVTGMSLGEAEEILGEKGFKVQVVEQESDKEPGEVLQQDPANTEEAVGTTITLKVAKLPSEVEVPSVTGATFEAAKRRLEKDGFSVEITKKVLAVEDIGMVVDQSPSPLTMHARGGTVQVKVNKEGVEVPPLIGKQLAKALDMIKKLPLEIEVKGYGGTKFSDKIKSTEPEAGEIVALQTNIVATPHKPSPPPKKTTTSVPTHFYKNWNAQVMYPAQQLNYAQKQTLQHLGRISAKRRSVTGEEAEPTIEPTIAELLEQVPQGAK